MTKTFALTTIFVAALASSAFAGGFSRGSADTDILFEDGKVAARAGVTYVNPNKKYEYNAVPGLRGAEYADTYVIPSLAAKVNITDDFRCAGTFYRPYTAGSTNDTMDIRGKLTEQFHVNEYGATCAMFVQAGKGNLFFLGGGFIETFDYDFTGFTNGPVGLTPLAFDLGSTDVGYRLGVGYEIPEIAFRTQLLYRSGTDHDADGTARLSQFGLQFLSYGQGSLPQSLEFKVQSGIAQDWVAFGSVRWQDWSQFKTLDVQLNGVGFQNQYNWRDGWTIQGGVAHKFNDEWSALASIAWDRGVSTGYDLLGDSYVFSAAVTHKDQWGGELRLGGSLIRNTAVEETAYAPGLNASQQSSWGYGLNVSYKKSF